MRSRKQVAAWSLAILWGLGAILASYSIVVQIYGSAFRYPVRDCYAVTAPVAWLLLPIAWRKMQHRYVGMLVAIFVPTLYGLGVFLFGFSPVTLLLLVCLAGCILLALFWRQFRHPLRVGFISMGVCILGAALGAVLTHSHVDPSLLRHDNTLISMAALFLVTLIVGFLVLPMPWAIACGIASWKGAARHLVWGIYLLVLLGTSTLPAVLFVWLVDWVRYP